MCAGRRWGAVCGRRQRARRRAGLVFAAAAVSCAASQAPPSPAPAQAVGRTRHNKLCYFPGDGVKLKGQLVQVHIDRIHAYTLFGRQID